MPNTSPVHDTEGIDISTAQDVGRILDWYAANARSLPWRDADRSPWGVLVSEVMLQQTQVSRVEPVWREWMERWPAPARLAAAPVAEIIRAWQGMGYPRRAMRLHAAARAIVEEHNGSVPDRADALRELPGIGEYTAAAVLAFAFGRSVPVLDTNVRRVQERWLAGRGAPASSSITHAERSRADDLLPGDGLAPTFSVAVMELGALVCTARSPSCERCPLQLSCRWRAAGHPVSPAPTRRQPFEGSDRQARGVLLRAAAHGPQHEARLLALWVERRALDPDAPDQAERALASLLADGLLRRKGGLIDLP